MSFISMDLLGPYSEMENGIQYALTIICMLTNYVFMLPIRTKTTEDVIIKAISKTSLFHLWGSKYILSDRGSEFISKQFTCLAKELGFRKLYTYLYTPTGNSVIERTHSFLKGWLKKIICNCNTYWDDIAHIAAMACNVFSTFFIRWSPILSNVWMGCLHAHFV